MRRALMGVIVAAGMLAGACAAPSAPPVDTAAEEEAIRAISSNWLALTQQKNAAAIAALFADNGRVIWAGQEPVVGPDAIAEFLDRDFKADPERSSNWGPDRIEVAASGDLAVEYGTYTSMGSDPGATVQEAGNYATVYRKVDGAWKILSDLSVPNAFPAAAN